MDKNLRVGGRFVDKDDNLLMVAEETESDECGGCFYEKIWKGPSSCTAERAGRPFCISENRDDNKSVIFIPAIDPAKKWEALYDKYEKLTEAADCPPDCSPIVWVGRLAKLHTEKCRQREEGGVTVAEIQGKIEEIVAEHFQPTPCEHISSQAEAGRKAVRDALTELSQFIEPLVMTFTEAAVAYGRGEAIRRRSWGSGLVLVGLDPGDRNATDWEIFPETNADGS